MVRVRAPTMNSCVLGIGFILAFANVVGCTYETTEQVQAEMRDAGVIASDASGDDAMKKGWALQTEMTKGFAGPINVTQKTFDEPDMHTVTLGIKASGPYGGSADDNGRGYSPIPEAYATVAFTLNGVDFVRKFNGALKFVVKLYVFVRSCNERGRFGGVCRCCKLRGGKDRE